MPCRTDSAAAKSFPYTFPVTFRPDTEFFHAALAEHNRRPGGPWHFTDLDSVAQHAVLARAQELKEEFKTKTALQAAVPISEPVPLYDPYTWHKPRPGCPVLPEKQLSPEPKKPGVLLRIVRVVGNIFGWAVIAAALLFCFSCLCSSAQSLPDSPSRSKAFWALASAGATVTILDSYTTARIHQRWIDTPSTEWRPCVVEAASPWLYGKHPGPLRSYAVGAGKIALFEGTAYWLKRRRSRFWSAPLVYALLSAPSVVHNFEECQ